MTLLLGGTGAGLAVITQDDFRMYYPLRNDRADRERVVSRQRSYATPWWPCRGGLVGDAGDTSVQTDTAYNIVSRVSQGAASRVGFIGVTRDANGAPLAGVTCSLFRTSDKLWIMDFVSRSDGTFSLQSWFSPDQHFIVYNKSGSPDVFGTTKQTLVGA